MTVNMEEKESGEGSGMNKKREREMERRKVENRRTSMTKDS